MTCVELCVSTDETSEDAERRESPMNDVADVNKPNVATTVLSIQHHAHTARAVHRDLASHPPPQQQQQRAGRWQGAVVNGRRRNVYRTNSRRRYDLTPAVRRCVVTDKPAAVAAAAVSDDIDTTQPALPPQPAVTTLFSRRHVINLDPLTPRQADLQVRAGGKARWQRQQTSHQLQTARPAAAVRGTAARADVSAGARLTTRRERTMTEENLLSATGKKLLDVGGSATARNGETCRVIELKLNSVHGAAATAAPPAGPHATRTHVPQRTAAAAAASLYHSTDGGGGGEPGHGHVTTGGGGGIVLPQLLSTHR